MCFLVADDATRTMVKDAVETLFEVKVVRVNVINAAGQTNTPGAQPPVELCANSGFKKAIVTLAPENRIPFFEGVE